MINQNKPATDQLEIDGLVSELRELVQQATALISPVEQTFDARASLAFRWRRRGARGFLQPVLHPHKVALADLTHIDAQKMAVVDNTKQFLAGFPANNVLLTGARGTGKSSLIKAVLTQFARRGLRLIEVDAHELIDLPDVIDLVYGRKERFIVFCDDLSFEAGDPGYKALKAVLDGSIASTSENVLVYATSNRRHLMPEYFSENAEARHHDGEIHEAEGVEEKISLSERFGLWLSFYPFDQEAYLDLVHHWIERLGGRERNFSEVDREALRFALSRGSRSGRVAAQFARHWVGHKQLHRKK